jgi:nitrate reductase delta subunit
MLRRSRHPGPKLGTGQLATAWQVVSLLLEYPTEELLGRRPLLADAVSGLPAAVREPVSQFLTTLETAPLGQLQRDYVETFDVTRRCCLYLTYFAHGDTRKRGLALVQFKQAYRKAGVEFEAAELPDHLSVVLEFGASYDAETAWRLLNDHRAGIEMLRIALAEKGSP